MPDTEPPPGMGEERQIPERVLRASYKWRSFDGLPFDLRSRLSTAVRSATQEHPELHFNHFDPFLILIVTQGGQAVGDMLYQAITGTKDDVLHSDRDGMVKIVDPEPSTDITILNQDAISFSYFPSQEDSHLLPGPGFLFFIHKDSTEPNFYRLLTRIVDSANALLSLRDPRPTTIPLPQTPSPR